MELNKIIKQVRSDIFASLQEVDLKLLANLSCIGSGVFSLKLVDVNHIDEFLKDLAYRDYYDLVEQNIDKIKALKTPENDMLIKGFFLIDNGLIEMYISDAFYMGLDLSVNIYKNVLDDTCFRMTNNLTATKQILTDYTATHDCQFAKDILFLIGLYEKLLKIQEINKMTDTKLLLIALCYLREQISDLNDANPDPIFKQAKSF